MASATGKRLLGKVAIVTGGSSGYGAGIARRFANEGAKVCIADINAEAGAQLASTLPGSSFFPLNVAVKRDWEDLVKSLEKEHGQIDCLINNAGTTYPNKETLKVTEADFDKCFDVNVKGVFFGVSTLLPHFIKNGKGASIVNVASVGATRPRPGLVWYNASKGAIWNVTKGLAAEYGPHKIRVNSVCPLLGATGLFKHFSGVDDTPENRTKFLSNVPLGRLCEPEDVANACLFFASDESQFVTGINMEVDGGRAV